MAGHRALTIALAALALISAAAVLPALAPAPLLSTAHTEPNDVDGDEVLDELDNCPNTPNGSQLDTDNDAEAGPDLWRALNGESRRRP